MKPLALTDCIRSTPSRTLVALTRELSLRARRSLSPERPGVALFSDPADAATVPAWQAALRAISPGSLAPTRH